MSKRLNKRQQRLAQEELAAPAAPAPAAEASIDATVSDNEHDDDDEQPVAIPTKSSANVFAAVRSAAGRRSVAWSGSLS
jgi:hypothetical protein